MDPKLIITVLFLISATVIAAQEYVRPPPRKALHFPCSRKPYSLPQQVSSSSPSHLLAAPSLSLSGNVKSFWG
ncbi:hypothetical protein EV1_030225 [Malus domestica]